MSRYVLFGGEDQEHLCGGKDAIISKDDLSELKSIAEKSYKHYRIYDPTCDRVVYLDWFNILDVETLDIVFDHYQVTRE